MQPRRPLLGALVLATMIGGCSSDAGPESSVATADVETPAVDVPLVEIAPAIFDLGDTSLSTATNVGLSPDGDHVFWASRGEVCIGSISGTASPHCLDVDVRVDKAVWNPGGSAVALSEHGSAGVYLFEPDSVALTDLAAESCGPADGCSWRIVGDWSPDGGQLAVKRLGSDEPVIEILSVEGGHQDTLPFPEGAAPGFVHWGRQSDTVYLSARVAAVDNRRWAVWRYSQAGLNGANPNRVEYEIAAVFEESRRDGLALIGVQGDDSSAATGGRRVVDLESGDGADLTVPEGGSALFFATFSPDGSSIAFTWRRTDPTGSSEDVLSVVAFDPATKQFGERVDLLFSSDLLEPRTGPLSFGRFGSSGPSLIWRTDNTFVIPAGRSRFVVFDATAVLP